MGTTYYLICQFHKQAIDLDKNYGCRAGNPFTGELYVEPDWRGLLTNAKTPTLPKIQEFLEEHHDCRLFIADDEQEPWDTSDLNEKGWEVLMWDGEDRFTLTTDENREAYWNDIASK